MLGFDACMERHIGMAGRFGHDECGGLGMAGGLYVYLLEGDELVTCLDHIALVDEQGKAVALHVHCIHTDMDEQLGAVGKLQAAGVAAVLHDKPILWHLLGRRSCRLSVQRPDLHP